MACPICGGAGDDYYCNNPDCKYQGAIACSFCVGHYNYKCPECGQPLDDEEEV